VWFKAVGKPNLREYSITLFLCSELPAHMPRILGTKPEWHAWVALEADGVPLSQTNDFGSWRQAVHDLAAMQKESRDLTGELLRLGARDMRTNSLDSQIERFLLMARELMAYQVQEQPRRLTDAEFSLLEEDLRRAFATLLRDSTPDSVLHLDLHPDNVIASNAKTVFLDWAETAVGHPFLSFAYFLEHFRRQFADSDRGLENLIREYLGVWNFEESRGIARTLSACALAALFAYAISTPMDRDKILRDQNLAGFYRSLARRMKRYGERTRSEALSFREVIA
jgi:thiamine kinase-like enzyme